MFSPTQHSNFGDLARIASEAHQNAEQEDFYQGDLQLQRTNTSASENADNKPDANGGYLEPVPEDSAIGDTAPVKKLSSKKTEGMQSDKRYICYLCKIGEDRPDNKSEVKLFTRRRSVRDHIAKQHNGKTFDPNKAVEVIVKPHTNEIVSPEDLRVMQIETGSSTAANPTILKDRYKKEKPEKPEKTTTPLDLKPPPKAKPKEKDGSKIEEPVKPAEVLPAPSSDVPLESATPIEIKKQESSDDLPIFATPKAVVGMKRPAPDSEETTPSTEKKSKKKGTATKVKPPKAAAAPAAKKKKLTSSETSTGTVIHHQLPSARSPSVSSQASKTPVAALKKSSKPHKSSSLASSPAPSERQASSAPSAAESDQEPATPSSKAVSRYGTPASLARAPTSNAMESVEPNIVYGEEGSESDDELYCICRKGDNHQWMIGCDGPCKDWYHGKCVGIAERDGNLIDKYYCPKCTVSQGVETSWKRLCRRKVCRQPARVLADPPSKYCSDACGRKFMAELVCRSDNGVVLSKDAERVHPPRMEKKMRPKKVAPQPRRLLAYDGYNDSEAPSVSEVDHEGDHNMSTSDSDDSERESPSHTRAMAAVNTDREDNERVEYETDTSTEDEMPLPSVGGQSLKFQEIQMLAAHRTKDIETWKSLSKFRPASLSADTKVELNANEAAEQSKNTTKLRSLDKRTELLRLREKFLEMAKDRSSVIIDKVLISPDDGGKKKKAKKDLCGFDTRLTWSEHEFDAWTQSPAGKAQLEKGVLDDPPTDVPSSSSHNGKKLPNGVGINGHNRTHDSDDADEDADDESESDFGGPSPKHLVKGNCVKNRCTRHRQWYKMHLGEIRFELDLLGKERAKVERAEASVRERAVLRAWEGRPN